MLNRKRLLRRLRILAVTLFFGCVLSSQARAETIYYSMRQMGYDGEARLSMVGPTVYKDHQTVLILFKANGKNFSDEENIYVDPVTYRPMFVERNFSLGIFGRGKIEEEYLPGKVIITKTDRDRITTQVINKAGNIDNIYGFIFKYRKDGSFKIGDVLNMTLPTRDLKVRLVKRVVLKIGDKSYDSYYMQSQPARYKLWFDASPNKLPLRITGSIGLISSVMTMTGYDSTVCPVPAKTGEK